MERSGRKIALDIRVKKQMFDRDQSCLADCSDAIHQPLLSNVITTLISIEMGKCLLVRESQEEVKAEQHQFLLEEVSRAITSILTEDLGCHQRFWGAFGRSKRTDAARRKRF
jgi:hypothetical protein